nr:carbohydrate kinase family protein [Anaerolineae bacterium]
MKTAITGSIAFDYIMTYPGKFSEMLLADELDHISVSFLVDDMARHRGGVAPNIAYTLALLGERPLLVGAAGRDFSEYCSALEAVGVDTSGVHLYNDLFTASFFVSTDQKQNQIAMFYAGAMARSKDIQLIDVLPDKTDLVVISPNDPTAMRQYVASCKANNIPYLYDPSQQVARMGGEELAEGVDGAHLLIVNDYEYMALMKKTGLSHDDLLTMAKVVIVTKGSGGSIIHADGREYTIPVAPPDAIKDPTGVGDAFRAGLLKGIASGWDWSLCGQIGSLCATYVLEQIGTQNHTFTPQEFVTRFRLNFDDHGALDALL